MKGGAGMQSPLGEGLRVNHEIRNRAPYAAATGILIRRIARYV